MTRARPILPRMPRLAPFLGLYACLHGPVAAVAQDRSPVVAGRPEADWRDDLRNPQPIVRQAALEALAQFADVTSATILYLIPLVGDPDVAVRRTAIRAIGHGGRAAMRAAPALWRAWRDDDALVSADAGIALVQISSDHITKFRERLGVGEARDRARAAAALANAGSAARGAIHALRDHVGDEDARVRGAVFAALVALDETPGATTATLAGRSLARELSDAPGLDDAESMARVRAALTLLTRAGRNAKGAARPLQLLLWDGPAPLRTAAARVLGKMAGQGDDALTRALAAGDLPVREAAMAGLLVGRDRRRSMRLAIDTLKAIDPAKDTARTRTLIEALGYVATPNRDLDRALSRVLSKEPSLAGVIGLARRRLTIGF